MLIWKIPDACRLRLFIHAKTWQMMVQTKQHRGGYLLTDVCTSEESIAQTNLIEKSRNLKFVFSTFRLSRETFPPSQIFIRPTTGKYIQRSSCTITALSLIGREHWYPPEGMRRNGRSRIFPAYNPHSLSTTHIRLIGRLTRHPGSQRFMDQATVFT
jgi:hypothetical protein